jgi:putative ABC transport system permease protein
MSRWRRGDDRNWQHLLEEEIRAYLEHETEDNIARGMSPEAARQAALRKFGNVTRVREDTRAVWTLAWLEQSLQDIGYGLRMLRRNPGFSAAVTLTLALGIGMNSAMFSVMDAALFRHISYPDPERLVWVATYDTGWQSETDIRLLPADYAAFREQAQSFESMTAYDNADLAMVYGGEGATERIAWVSGEFWRTAGVRPALGRLFGADETHAIVLSQELFQRRFGGDAGVIGRPVSIDGQTFAVAGVLPERFRLEFPQFLYSDDERKGIDAYIAIPDAAWHLPTTAYRMGNWEKLQEEFGLMPPFVWVVGKLKPTASLDRARTELETTYARVIRESPGIIYHTHSALRVQPLQTKLAGGAAAAFVVLGGAVGFVLLIVCANIANLLLARATSRRREVAIRRALGAGGVRLVRQFLTESALFATAGAAGGAMLARAIVAIVVRIGGEVVPRLADARIDGRVLVFTAAASIVSAALFGLGPAVSLLRTDMQKPLKEDAGGYSAGAGRFGVRAALAALEVAAAIVLLSGAGLMLKSFWRMSALPPGYSPNKILAMKFSLAGARYANWPQQQAYLDELLGRMATVPGAEAAGLHCGSFHTTIQVEGVGADQPVPATIEYVSPGYLRAIGVPLLAGQWPDDMDLGAVVINQSLARRLMRPQGPVGRQIHAALLGGRIAGIVPDFKTSQLDAEPNPAIYAPYQRSPRISSIEAIVRVAASAAPLAPAIRERAAGIDTSVPVYRVATIESELADSVAPRRFNLILLGSFAAVAVLLAFIGIYGVIAYLVAQRTREIGIRVALGASRADVTRMVLQQGSAIIGVGVAVGILAALGLGRVMASLLYGVRPNDPWTLLAVAGSLTIVALLACLGPSWRAARIDPLIAIRGE